MSSLFPHPKLPAAAIGPLPPLRSDEEIASKIADLGWPGMTDSDLLDVLVGAGVKPSETSLRFDIWRDLARRTWEPAQGVRSFREVIALFGGTIPFSAATGLPADQVRVMKKRNSIAPDHWSRIATAAASRGLALTLDDLVRLRTAPQTPAA